jgi:hypothetical protein
MNIQKTLSIFLVYVLCLGGLLDARSGGDGAYRTNNEEKQKTFKQKLTGIPAGSIVEVKLHNKQTYRGRLGQLTDQGFTVQHATGNTIQDKNVSFADLKSINQVKTGSGASNAVTWVVLGALAGVGVVVIVLLTAIMRN